MQAKGWRPWLVAAAAWLLCGCAQAEDMWAVCMWGGTYPPAAGCTAWTPTPVEACKAYEGVYARNVVMSEGFALVRVNEALPAENGSGCSIAATVVNLRTGQELPSWTQRSGWTNQISASRIESEHDKTNDCEAPRFGDPIYPLTGSRAQAEVLGAWLAGGQALAAHYDTRRMVPTTDGSSRGWSVAALPSFSGLWHSSWHRSLAIQFDAQAVQAARGGGAWVSFQRDASGQYLPDADVNDRLLRLPGNWRYIDAATRSEELYDNDGRLGAIDFAGGERLEFSYGSGSAAGLLMKVQDSRGRSVQFQYEQVGVAMRIHRIVDPAGAVIAVTYSAGGQLASLVWPDGAQRQFLYEVAERGWALTGLVDENARRMATYGYDADGLATSTELAGGVDRYTVSYSVPPRWKVDEVFDPVQQVLRVGYEWQAPQGVSVSLPQGGSTQLGTSLVQGMARLDSRSQPAGSGCEASTSASVLDAHANVVRRDDFKGGRSCHTHDMARNLERSRVEGLTANASCAAVLDNATAWPAGARRISTQWHPDWALAAVRSSPRELQLDVYNGQRDPLTGSLASCADGAQLPDGKPIAVLCKRTELTTTDIDGSQALADAVASDPVNAEPGDANYPGVSSLLHLDGGNGATTITDDGPGHHAWTTTGNAALSTAQSKFGGASFNAGSGAAVSPVTADYLFGSGDFTVEAWVYRTATPSSVGAIVALWATGKCSWYLGVDASNRLVFYTSTLGNGGFSFPAAGNVPGNAWVHVAVTRQGTSLRFFVNGVLVGTTSISGALYAPVGSNATLGAEGDIIHQWPGYIDEVRVTKGVARYTAAFAVPVAPFPASVAPVPGSGGGSWLAKVDASVPARTWAYTYNPLGQVLTATDAASGTTTWAYFADTTATHTKGDLKSITTSSGKVTTFDKYNAYGQVLQSTDPRGVVTVNTYDLRQRLRTRTVGSELTSFDYDLAGQLKKVTFDNGSWVGFDYDDAHRQVAAYDNRSNRIDYVLDNLGNRKDEQAKDPAGALKRALARAMDALGREQQGSGRE